MSETSQWQLGLVIGIVVIAVAAAIVITIVLLAQKIAKQAKTAEGAVEVLRQQTAELPASGRSTTPACASCTPPVRCGRWRSADEQPRLLVVALGIGLVAALVVAFLLAVLVRTVISIEKSVDGLLVVATQVAGNTAAIPQLEATAPVLEPDRAGGRRAGWLHERPHRRVRWAMSSTDLLARSPSSSRSWWWRCSPSR